MAQTRSTGKIQLPFHTVETLQDRLSWSINVRWAIIFILLASVPLGKELFHFHLAYLPITLLTSILLILNITYFFLLHYAKFKSEWQELTFAEIQIGIDLIIVSYLIHYAGGIDNPFFILYLLEVIHSAILFPGRVLPYLNAVFAAILLTLWTLLESTGAVEVYALRAEKPSLPIIITSLLAFYGTCFFSVYIINNFMLRYSELKSLIDDKNHQLQKAIIDRGRIFRFTAHELKSPISTIKSTLEVVRKIYGKELNPQALDMVLRAESRSDQVLDIVKDMIEITQYNLGQDTPKHEVVDFGDWLFQIVIQHQAYAASKHITLFVAPFKRKVEVDIDRNGMEKVLNNLVNNALRYTPADGNVLVEPILSSAHFGFAVHDSGIGIAAEDLDKIFDEFYRTKEAKDMEKIGTGLGLNLVQQIVQNNGGMVKVESQSGKGSVFTVLLPYPS